MKKFLIFALCLVMMVTAMAIPAFAFSNNAGVTATLLIGDSPIASDTTIEVGSTISMSVVFSSTIADSEGGTVAYAAKIPSFTTETGNITATYNGEAVTLTVDGENVSWSGTYKTGAYFVINYPVDSVPTDPITCSSFYETLSINDSPYTPTWTDGQGENVTFTFAEPAEDAVVNLSVTVNDGYVFADGLTLEIGQTIELEYTLSNVTDGTAITYTVPFQGDYLNFTSASFNDADVTSSVVTNEDGSISYSTTASGDSSFCVVLTAATATFSGKFLYLNGFSGSKVTVSGTDVAVSEPAQTWNASFQISDPSKKTPTMTFFSFTNFVAYPFGGTISTVGEDWFSFQIDAKNYTDAPADITVVANIGEYVTFVQVDSPDKECTYDETTNTVTVVYEDVPAGETAQAAVVVDVSGLPIGTFTNVFSATAQVSGQEALVAYVDGDDGLLTEYDTISVTFTNDGSGDSGDSGDSGENDGTSDSDTSTENSITVDNDNIDSTPHASIEVIGKLDSNNNNIPDDEEDPLDPADPTIAVDIYWTDMVFCYSQSWDEVNLTYVWNWTNGEDYIRVDNRSSVGIDASVTFTGDTANGFEDDAVEFAFDEASAVAAEWDGSTLTLGFGNQIDAYEDTDGDGVVTPSGTLNVNVAATTTMDTTIENNSVTLGQITVNISQAEAAVETTVVLTLNTTATSADAAVPFNVLAGTYLTVSFSDADSASVELGELAVKDADGNLLYASYNETNTTGFRWEKTSGILVIPVDYIGQTLNVEVYATINGSYGQYFITLNVVK